MNEQELLTAYAAAHLESDSWEVPAGNCLLRRQQSVLDSGAGSLSYNIDLLGESNQGGHPILVEGKQTLDFVAIGQILQYSDCFRRDRAIVRENAADRGGYWDSFAQVKTFKHHVYETTDETGTTIYRPKQAIKTIDQRIVVNTIQPPDLYLLSVCRDLGISVTAYAGGQWHGEDLYNVQPPTTSSQPDLDTWLARNSNRSLDSPAEDQLPGRSRSTSRVTGTLSKSSVRS